MSELRRTPLYAAHVAAHAKLVPFAGFEMPVQYTGLIQEHRAVREAAGLFDVSHMGELVVQGAGARTALQRLVSNDLSKVIDGQAQYSVLCNDQGGIVDDVVVYRRGAEDFLVCVNAANRAKDFDWFRERGLWREATLSDQGDDYAQLALQGPRAAAILGRLTVADLGAIKNYRFVQTEVAGRRLLLARTGYTGEDGFELFCKPGDALPLWEALMETGRVDGLIPCGLGARDSLRTEMKYSLYGNDIDDTTSPLEAGLSWVVKLEKAGGAIGWEALGEQRQRGLQRRLIGFQLQQKGVPRHGYPVKVDGQTVGAVTSGTLSPSLDLPIGMAYLPRSHSEAGAEFEVEIRGRSLPARVVATPFYHRPSA